jgi:hypothetical protein
MRPIDGKCLCVRLAQARADVLYLHVYRDEEESEESHFRQGDSSRERITRSNKEVPNHPRVETRQREMA